MPKNSVIPAIYISYAWNPQSEAIVESVEGEFQKRGVRIIRDKNDLGYKGRIKEFMEQLGRGKYVILVISNKYLRSENCMFELLQIFENQDFYERIFPVVLDEVKIAKAADRLDLVKYWEKEAENLDNKIRELKELANIQGVSDDLNLFTEIRNNIARLTHILKDINTLNTDQHIHSDFRQLCDLVQDKIKMDLRGTGKTKAIKRGALAILVFLVALFAFQGINRNNWFKGNDNQIDSMGLAKARHDSIARLKEAEKVDTLKTTEARVEKKDEKISDVRYKVKLIIPSNMAKATVFVDNEPAEIIERNLIFIEVRLRKKNSSHHFEIKDGPDSCSTDKLISQDNMQLTLCD